MTGHSVRFDKNTDDATGTGDGGTGGGGTGSSGRLTKRRRAPYQSQPNLHRLHRYGSRAASMYRLNHLNPQQRQSLGKSYINLRKSQHSVHIAMDRPNRGMYSNKHIASAHRLISSIQDDEPNFKSRLRSVMNTYNFQILMVVLIILDCVMVLGEMIIELRLFQNEDCAPYAHEIVSSTVAPMLPTTIKSMIESNESEHVVESIEHGTGSHHDAHEHENHCRHFEHLLHNVEHVFHLTSIFILFLFNVELVVRLYAEGYKYFLHLEIALDAMIVMISFGLDIVFLDHKMKKYLFLLIILRVWRVLRVVHAIITAIRAPHERQIEKLKKKKKMLQRDLAKAYFYSNMLEEEIKNLRQIIDSFEIIEEYDDEDEVNDKIPVFQRSVQSESGINGQIDQNQNQQQK